MNVRGLFGNLWKRVKAFSPFMELTSVLLVAGGTIMNFFSKSTIHLFINGYHSEYGDVFFTNATFLGDGVSAAILVVVLLFVNYRFAAMTVVSTISSGVIVQVLKRTLFAETVRPYEFFKGVHDLYLVPGIAVYSYNSFPSGHSATIFAVCAILSLMTRHKFVRVFLFLLACVIAFSRVYLSQHFFGDVIAGALIGSGLAYVTAVIFEHLGTVDGSLERSILSFME